MFEEKIAIIFERLNYTNVPIIIIEETIKKIKLTIF